MSNRVTLKDLEGMSTGDLCKIPVDMLPLLQDDLAAMKSEFQIASAQVQRLFDARYADTAEGERSEETGTVYLDDGEWVIRCEVRKKVNWDQDRLNAVLDKIEASGEKREDYAEFKAFIPENRFKHWPKPIRDQFIVARNVVGSTPSYQMRRR